MFYFLFLLCLSRHPVHVVTTDIDYKTASHTLQLTHRIFTDDLEKELELSEKKAGSPVRLHIGTPKEHPATDALITRYLASHFALAVNGKAVALKWVGKEQEGEATWVYLEAGQAEDPTGFEVTNTILLELYDDQQNLVHLKAKGQKKSLKFRKGETSNTWKL